MSYEILLILSLIGYYISFTSLQFTFVYQTSAFLQVLQHQLETYGPKRKSIYKQHAIVIQLIQKYNELFSGQMCLEIMVSSLQPCGHGIALIKVSNNQTNSNTFYFNSSMNVFCKNFCDIKFRDKILIQVEKLHKSTYENLWYEEKPEIRRDLLIMMSITGNPPTLNYKRWIYFNYIAFATVMQGVYSYMSMLANF
ncbi:hypothetical protein O3M35_009789 [Rhynocoris fuscipes]|uniref:Uncharacterized protein n=1 Tax=Rhynocoris fuscipes TaxID=488301 RepID=A0AAW1D4A2_9HEMI